MDGVNLEIVCKEESRKFKRKLERKQNKYKHVVLECIGIEQSSQPSKFLMVCNAGLVSGVSEALVVQLFSKFGQLECVTMLRGKSYCFVTFGSVSDANEAFENINGKHKFTNVTGKLYLMYTTGVPFVIEKSSCTKPAGLILLEDFVSEEEEYLLLNCINWSKTETQSGKSAVLKHRRVKHYGYEFNYSNNNVDKSNPLQEQIPDKCTILKDKLERCEWGHLMWPPDQLTVNEYQPGQGIPLHVDTHSAFESPIISLSLGSEVVMDFKHEDGRDIQLHLPRRSLLIMDGESRYDWRHGITPRKTDVVYKIGCGLAVVERGTRTSFTFRWLRNGNCNCNYPKLCDSQLSTDSLECVASHLESLHVHKVYEEISTHFSQTRYKAWPNVANFVNSLELGSFLYDVGCGNGKYFGINKQLFELGCDRSSNLAEICKGRGYEVLQCDCLQLPLKTGCIDAVISIAVIHHLSTRDRRIDALKEMARVLRVGGQGLVYVWARHQRRNNISSMYLNNKEKSENGQGALQLKEDRIKISDGCKIDDGLDIKSEVSLPVHSNRTEFKHEDLLIPWTFKEKTFYRYYHVFNMDELDELCQAVENISIVKSYYDQGNWCVIFKKNS